MGEDGGVEGGVGGDFGGEKVKRWFFEFNKTLREAFALTLRQ